MSTSLGIDVGGSGIKAALIDVDSGATVGESRRIDTPQPATPPAIAHAVGSMVAMFDRSDSQTPIGVALPAVVRRGFVDSAANIDPTWIGVDAVGLFSEHIGRDPVFINDADAAGLSEARFGSARGIDGLVIVATLGTGIGTALIDRGRLTPNAELGHIEIEGHDAETRASARAKRIENLTWEQWASRVSTYLQRIEALLSPDLFVLGGEISNDANHFIPLLETRTPVRAATHRNLAGVIGAARLASEALPPNTNTEASGPKRLRSR